MKLFAIFGDPVSHSRSPLMHNSVFRALGYNACYTRVHLRDGTKLKETFFSLKLSGANVTVPHKEEAFRACDEVRGFAKSVGVVNTLINENGRLIGYNTDSDGFMFAIEEFGEIKNVLILGAGGTAKALASRFAQDNIKVSVLNRSEARLSYFNKIGCEISSWDSYKSKNYDLVINTTSAGLKDEELPASKEMVEDILTKTSFVADVIYGKLTPFLSLAKEHNITYKDGADMLLGQGILANELFVNKELSLKNIKTHMQKSFEL
ncbi:shikimate dehydrogenase [Sulfurimonas hongkongensis]|uniref:Shikimate dehydrogenase (NADP(+)) n=1 Tax=Sulfurimonas hongkongensis TaxID=1172190 RepID=T0JEY5_9BACT|nr:shikimate dehydrogenase [Sulfurimonas hongkongensis]EQB35397.1 shikimate dehydrogenase [Sulfurimonas hongkongensis]